MCWKREDANSCIVMGAMLAVMIGIAVYLLTGTVLGLRLPQSEDMQEIQVFERKVNDEEGYAYLVCGERVFVPYCSLERKYLGERIGYYDVPAEAYTEAHRVYIYSFKGYPSDEWIVDLVGRNCAEGMIWREKDATEIPGGLTSEYKWNN